MDSFFHSEDISVDFGLDEPDLGQDCVGYRRGLRFAALVQSNDPEFILVA